MNDSFLSRPSKLSNTNTPAPSFSVRTLLWACIHCAFYFLQQLAELLAPLCLIGGIGWSVLPHLVSSLSEKLASAEPQASHLAGPLAHLIPTEISLAGFSFTASGLIMDGLLLMLFAAIGSTLSTLASREM